MIKAGTLRSHRLTACAEALILAGLLLLLQPGPVRAAYPHPQAPRLLNYYLRDDFIGNEAALARWDLVVLAYRHLDTATESLARLRELNPSIRILIYIDPMCISREAIGTPGNLHYDFQTGIDSLWIAYTSEGDSISYWENTLHVNVTAGCPQVGGLRYRDYFLSFLRERLSPYVSDGTVDGIFLDEMSQGGYLWWDPRFPGCFDYDLDHACDDPDSLATWLNQAVCFFADSAAAAMPAGSLIMGNNCVPLQPALNGNLFERFPSTWEGGLPGTLNSLDLLNAFGHAVTISGVNGVPSDPTNLREFRYRFAGSLLADCYFNYDYGSTDHHQVDWFELFDFNLGRPLGPRHTLGETPLVTVDFEAGLDPLVVAVPGMSQLAITEDPEQVLAGSRSLRCETLGADPWPGVCELSIPGGYHSGQWYTVSFLYRVLDCLPTGSHLLLKAQYGGCTPAESAQIPIYPGSIGCFRGSLRLGACSDYRLLLRAEGSVQVVVDSLVVMQGRGGMLVRDYERGVVVCNDSGEVKSLPFDPAWELVDGDRQRQDYPGWLNGQGIHILNKDGLVFHTAAAGADPRLNEFLAVNHGTNQDESGEFESWVELHNRGGGRAALGGLFLSNDLAASTRWRLPDVNLPPGGFVVIWCDGEPTEGRLHTNFELAPGGGELGLFDRLADGNALLDSCSYATQYTDFSRGRLPFETGDWVVCNPTPGASNSPATASPQLDASLRLWPGYPNPFGPRTWIRYTLPRNGQAELVIYDVTGRRIKMLLAGELPAGGGSAVWDGTDDAGRPAAAGVYFARLEAAGAVQSQRLVLFR